MMLSITSITYLILVFSSLTIYWLLNERTKTQNIFLLIISYLIYCFITYWLGIIIFISTIINYFSGFLLGKIVGANKRKLVFYISIIFNVGYLFVFKYFDFFSQEVNEFLSIFGISTNLIILKLLLPVGISFYTLQMISYNFDVYNGKISPIRKFIAFNLFVAFFPKISSGPIESASNLIPQFERKKHLKRVDFGKAIQLLLLGFFKKIVIADFIAYNINPFFDNPSEYSSTDALIFVILFTLQLYADFSGYTDITRGISKLFGINLTYNFNQPFLSTSIRDFWRRWHISFSNWLRDYIYIPLGGSKKGTYRMFWNLMIVFIICGIWHGAGINFIIFGVLHGLFIILQRLYSMAIEKWSFYRKIKSIGKGGLKKFVILRKLYKLIAWFILFQFVCFAFLFLRADDFNSAVIIIQKAYSFNNNFFIDIWANIYFRLLVFFFIIIFIIDYIQFKLKTHYIFTNLNWFFKAIIYTFIVITIFLFRVEEFTPFIYAGY